MEYIYVALLSLCCACIVTSPTAAISDTPFNVQSMYLVRGLFECGDCQSNVSTTPISTLESTTHSTRGPDVFRTTVRTITTETPAGLVDEKCLRCICQVESLCEPADCHMDQGSMSCGYYQMKWEYYIDCGQPGGLGVENWERCSKDKACAEECIHNYMARYASLCAQGSAVTCETFARIHNGGPTGCTKSSTVGYWALVNACYA